MASHTLVSIRILDVNDNPPELATPYEASICEDAKPGQVCFYVIELFFVLFFPSISVTRCLCCMTARLHQRQDEGNVPCHLFKIRELSWAETTQHCAHHVHNCTKLKAYYRCSAQVYSVGSNSNIIDFAFHSNHIQTHKNINKKKAEINSQYIFQHKGKHSSNDKRVFLCHTWQPNTDNLQDTFTKRRCDCIKNTHTVRNQHWRVEEVDESNTK